MVFVSNFEPDYFPNISKDDALMEKLIKVYLGPELIIQPENQIPNFGRKLDSYLPDIFNWVMFGKNENCQLFVRVNTFNQIFYSQPNINLKVLPAFLTNCCFEKKGAFTTLKTVQEVYKNYVVVFNKRNPEGTYVTVEQRSIPLSDFAELLRKNSSKLFSKTIFMEERKVGIQTTAL